MQQTLSDSIGNLSDNRESSQLYMQRLQFLLSPAERRLPPAEPSHHPLIPPTQDHHRHWSPPSSRSERQWYPPPPPPQWESNVHSNTTCPLCLAERYRRHPYEEAQRRSMENDNVLHLPRNQYHPHHHHDHYRAAAASGVGACGVSEDSVGCPLCHQEVRRRRLGRRQGEEEQKGSGPGVVEEVLPTHYALVQRVPAASAYPSSSYERHLEWTRHYLLWTNYYDALSQHQTTYQF